MSKYRRVTQEDRIRIKDALDAGLTKSAIADKLGFHKSTISREIRRNSGKRGYRPKQAQRMADVRQEHRARFRKRDRHLARKVRKLLAKKWSPEQISGRLKLEGHTSKWPTSLCEDLLLPSIHLKRARHEREPHRNPQAVFSEENQARRYQQLRNQEDRDGDQQPTDEVS